MHQPLRNLLTKTNFCVVGNSPKEIGKKQGALIDSFDIVVRFKNYITEDYEEDYGSKTDVWATPFNLTQFYREPDQYRAVLCSLPLNTSKWKKIYSPSNIDYQLMNRYNGIVEFIPVDLFEECKTYYGSGQASTGINILYWIYKLIGPINKKQIFGFSMFDPHEDHHYFLSKELNPKTNPQKDPRRQQIQRGWFGCTPHTHPRQFEKKVFDLITLDEEKC